MPSRIDERFSLFEDYTAAGALTGVFVAASGFLFELYLPSDPTQYLPPSTQALVAITPSEPTQYLPETQVFVSITPDLLQ